MKYSRLKPEHKVMLDSAMTELERKAKDMTRQERIEAIEAITETYTITLEYRLDSRTLERMANLILNEELTDRHPDKMTRNEYPIMSPQQERGRTQGLQRDRRKDGTTVRETVLEHASNVASDGKNYTLPIRNFKNPQ